MRCGSAWSIVNAIKGRGSSFLQTRRDRCVNQDKLYPHVRNFMTARATGRDDPLVFVDTNVFIYARDTSEADKQLTATSWLEHLWATQTGRISFQVLQEYYVTATRKLDPPIPQEIARAHVRALETAWRPVATDEATLEQAWRLEDQMSISFWDALIVAAATRAGCSYLLTEDFQHGRTIDSLKIIDPFQVTPDEL